MLKPKPINIFKSAWPDIILANSLIVKLITLEIWDNNSIKTKNNFIGVGIPSGNKITQIESFLWTIKQNILTASHIINEKKNVNTK